MKVYAKKGLAKEGIKIHLAHNLLMSPSEISLPARMKNGKSILEIRVSAHTVTHRLLFQWAKALKKKGNSRLILVVYFRLFQMRLS
jgi:hypothetical protein